MKKSLVSLVAVVAAVALLVGQAVAANRAATPTKVTVAMHDPGCHWFLVGGKYSKSVVRHGSVTLVNRDMAPLRIKGPSGTKIERVLGTLKLQAKGTYRITMVDQAPDDNHLVLTIK
jgi:hypothetical protein